MTLNCFAIAILGKYLEFLTQLIQKVQNSLTKFVNDPPCFCYGDFGKYLEFLKQFTQKVQDPMFAPKFVFFCFQILDKQL